MFPQNPLDDNLGFGHTVSLWLKPILVADHDSDERQFLYESTAEEIPQSASAYGLVTGVAFRRRTDKSVFRFTRTRLAGQPTSPNYRPGRAGHKGGFDLRRDPVRLLPRIGDVARGRR